MRHNTFKLWIICWSLMAMLIPRPALAAWDVWTIDDTAKMRPDQTLVNTVYSTANPSYKDTNMVWSRGANLTTIHGAKNEYTAFQVIIEATGETLTNVNVVVSDLVKGGDTLANTNVELFKEAYIQVIQASTRNGTTGVGWYPDALIPFAAPAPNGAPFTVNAGECQAVWVDLYLPKNTVPGTYTGTVTISAAGKTDININLNVVVWDFTLPDEASLVMNWRLYRLEIAYLYELGSMDWLRHTVDWNITKEYFKMAHKHRGQITVGTTRPIRTVDGITGDISGVDWTYFDSTFGTFLDGSGYDDGVPNKIWETDLGGGGGNPFSGYDMTYWQNYYTQAAAMWADHFQTKNWLHHLPFTYFTDEPSITEYYNLDLVSRMINTGSAGRVYFMVTEQAFPVDPVDEFYNQAYESQYGPDLWTRENSYTGQTAVDYPNWTGNADAKIDIWCPNGRFYFPSDPNIPETAETIKASGDLSWVYQGAGEPWIGNVLIDDNGLACRTWGWMGWKYQVDGMFMWCVNYWEKSTNNHQNLPAVYTNPNTWGSGSNVYNGDGVLFYPGHQVGITDPVSTIRMKAFRRGLIDYEYMRLLELLGDKTYADGQVDSIMTRAFNYYNPPTTLTAAANAGATTIAIASKDYIGSSSSILIKGNTPAEDEIRTVTNTDNVNAIAIHRALTYSHNNGNVVALRYAPYSWRSNYDTAAYWSKNPEDWYQARLNMADRIVTLGGIPQDLSAPAKVNDLHAQNGAQIGTVDLTWTASGDDGNSGTATSYDLRYNTVDPIAGAWGEAIRVTSAPTPQVAGSQETLSLSGLDINYTYYFRLEVIDDVGFHSPPSNVASPLDQTAPDQISNLTGAVGSTDGTVSLTWTASGDDANVGTAGYYDIRYATSDPNGNWNAATQVSAPPTPQVAGSAESTLVAGLTAGTTYYFRIQVLDDMGNRSTSSNLVSIQAPTVTPAQVTNLGAAGGTAEGSVVLTWTASGDDGFTGTAASYDIRYGTTDPNANWNAATQVGNAPTPKAAGGSETVTVSGLHSNTTYYFRLRVIDDIAATSVNSNVASAAATGIPPTAVADLSALGGSIDGTVILAWTATGDDANVGTATTYEIRYGTTDPAANWNAASLVGNPTAPKSSGSLEVLSISGLTAGTTYYFRLRVLDEDGNTSSNSNLATVAATGATTPMQIYLGAMSGSANGSVNLVWTVSRIAISYDIRYGTTDPETNWNAATQVTNPPTPGVAGNLEGMTLTGLTAGTTYYFRMRAVDEDDVTSASSNVVSAVATNNVTTTIVNKSSDSKEVAKPAQICPLGFLLAAYPQDLAVFTAFKQEYLAPSAWGRKFIAFYYHDFGPAMVSFLKKYPLTQSVFRIGARLGGKVVAFLV